MTLAPGARFGPYQVHARLGEGGMGIVWRATDARLERDVALKVLPEEFVEDPERLVRFEREARLLARLNHPNIAQIHGLLARLHEQAAHGFVSPYHFAYVHTGLGETDAALDWLERAFAQRSGNLYGIGSSFLFASLRGAPRFQALLARMNLA